MVRSAFRWHTFHVRPTTRVQPRADRLVLPLISVITLPVSGFLPKHVRSPSFCQPSALAPSLMQLTHHQQTYTKCFISHTRPVCSNLLRPWAPARNMTAPQATGWIEQRLLGDPDPSALTAELDKKYGKKNYTLKVCLVVPWVAYRQRGLTAVWHWKQRRGDRWFLQSPKRLDKVCSPYSLCFHCISTHPTSAPERT